MSLALRERAVSPLQKSLSVLSFCVAVGVLAVPVASYAAQTPSGGHTGVGRIISTGPRVVPVQRPVAIPFRIVPHPGSPAHRIAPHRPNNLVRPGHGHRRATPVWIDPKVYQTQDPVIIQAPPAAPVYGGPDHALAIEYFNRPRPRCTGPKIIQVGPIDMQDGPGPRLIYGARNPCEPARIENRYRARDAN